MEVILREFVPNLGKMGQLVRVADGYGRNYLFPRGLAVPATKRNKSELAHHTSMLGARAAKLEAAARELGARLSGKHVTIYKAVGETGKLYGSVTAMDIEDALHDKGVKDVNRRQILLDEPIKSLGDFDVSVRVHHDVNVDIKVTVMPRGES